MDFVRFTGECDEHVVDDPLAGEADEVHAPLDRMVPSMYG